MRHAILVGAALAALSTSAMGAGCPDPSHIVPGAYDQAHQRLPLGLAGFHRKWTLSRDGFAKRGPTNGQVSDTWPEVYLLGVKPNSNITISYANLVSMEMGGLLGKKDLACYYTATDHAGTAWTLVLQVKAKVKGHQGAWSNGGDGYLYCQDTANRCQFKLD